MTFRHIDRLLTQHHAQQADQCDQRRGWGTLSDAIIHANTRAQRETPNGLPGLEVEMGRGALARAQFCKMANDVLRVSSGEKGILQDIVGAAALGRLKAIADKSLRPSPFVITTERARRACFSAGSRSPRLRAVRPVPRQAKTLSLAPQCRRKRLTRKKRRWEPVRLARNRNRGARAEPRRNPLTEPSPLCAPRSKAGQVPHSEWRLVARSRMRQWLRSRSAKVSSNERGSLQTQANIVIGSRLRVP